MTPDQETRAREILARLAVLRGEVNALQDELFLLIEPVLDQRRALKEN